MILNIKWLCEIKFHFLCKSFPNYKVKGIPFLGQDKQDAQDMKNIRKSC
jgi:hypothetical protein